MLSLLPNSHVPTTQEEREKIDRLDIERLDLWQESFLQDASHITEIPCIRNLVFEMTFPISQKFSKYSSLPYGKVGTDENQNLLIMDGNLILDAGCPYRALVKRNFWEMASGIRCAWAWK